MPGGKETEVKKYFHLISHLLHQDKLDFFLKKQFGTWKISSSEKVRYVRNLTTAYIQLSKIYTDFKNSNHLENEDELFKRIHSILQNNEGSLNQKVEEIGQEIQRFKEGYEHETKQTVHKNFKKTKVYTGTTIRFEIDERDLKNLEIKTMQVINMLGEFKKLFVDPVEINNINLVVNLLSQVNRFAKGKLIHSQECKNLIERYVRILKNYHNFKYDWSIANNIGKVRKYCSYMTGKVVLVIYLSLRKTANDLVRKTIQDSHFFYQFRAFSYNVSEFEEDYEPKIFSKEELEKVYKMAKKLGKGI